MRNPSLALLKKTALAVSGHGLGRIEPIRAAYDFFYRLLRPSSVVVQGQRMWLDDQDSLELATREIYEPMETRLFKREIKPGQTVLDIGANIGYYTLIAAKLVGPAGKVYAFEPDPTNFKLLKKNVALNGHTNVVLVDRAVSNKDGKIRLYLNPANKGDHRIYDSKDGRSSITARTIQLDEYFIKMDRNIHFIKMDIQGAEAAALEGMKALIRRNRPLKLVTEFSPGSLKLSGHDPQKYLKTLQMLGFKLSEISEKGGYIKPVTIENLLGSLSDDSNVYTNLFCIKK